MKIEIFLKRNQKTYQSFPSDINSPNCAAAWWKLPCTTCIGRSGYPFHIVFGLPAAAAPPRQASRLVGPSEMCGARGHCSPYFSRSVIPISNRGQTIPWTSRVSGRKAMQARIQTVAMNYQFMYYDCSKIMLTQLHTKLIFHDFFWCLAFLIDLLSYSYKKNFPKMLAFENFTFFIKFFPTEASNQQFYIYDCSKIVLPQQVHIS